MIIGVSQCFKFDLAIEAFGTWKIFAELLIKLVKFGVKMWPTNK